VFYFLVLHSRDECDSEAKAEGQTKNGKVYWNMVKFEVNMKRLVSFKVQFDNLFNGDEALSKYQYSTQPNILNLFGVEQGKIFVMRVF
jgi:hypothetical protein